MKQTIYDSESCSKFPFHVSKVNAMPSYTVVLTTHKRPAFLARAIRSVIDQANAAVALVVVSDVACAETHHVCSTLLRQGDMFLQRCGTHGPAESRNLGMRLATGDFIVFLDDDDALSSNFLTNAEPYADATTLSFSNSVSVFERLDGDGLSPFHIERKDLASHRLDEIYTKNFIPFSCLLFPRESIADRWFDTALPLNEDWDFILNVISRFALRHIPIDGPIIYTRDAPDNRGRTNNELLAETYLDIYRKWPPRTPDQQEARNNLFRSSGLQPPYPAAPQHGVVVGIEQRKDILPGQEQVLIAKEKGEVPALRVRTVVEEAAILKKYYEDGGSVRLQPDDPVVGDMIKRFDAATIMYVVTSIAYPAGSDFNRVIYRRWLEAWSGRSQSEFAIWFNIGVEYAAAGDKENAVTAYKNALMLRPDCSEAALNLGTEFEVGGQLDAALAVWKQALQPEAPRTALINNCGRVLENRKQLTEAEEQFVASLLQNPKQPQVLHHLINLRTRMCIWPIFTTAIPGVSQDDMRKATHALSLLALVDDVADQTHGNAAWIDEKLPPAPQRLSPVSGYGHHKIRLGYLSSDFCRHPIAFLTAELFEMHDRSRFDVYGYCSTIDDRSDVRSRIINSFDHYVDIRQLSDEAAARRIRQDEIDILIDLNGLTLGQRLQVLRWKPAPVQMTYLGYNGPVPLPELDYIIADEFVIPPRVARTYHPKPLYMKRCFQVNDSQLDIDSNACRADVGLPDDKFVFCCFSNTYKITQEMFCVWMKILASTQDTVLWLYVDNPSAVTNLCREADRAGIERSRIIFANRVEPAQYRGRLRLADVFLDTYPYNSGTTASDALRVGLPLITLCGRSFIARMAGSLLNTMNLSECIVYSEDDYIGLAIKMTVDSKFFNHIKLKVTQEKWLQTLGDTAAFRDSIEEALQSVALTPKKRKRSSKTRDNEDFKSWHKSVLA